jgi:hypothetical protein
MLCAATLVIGTVAPALAEDRDNDRDNDRNNDKVIYSSIPKRLPGNVASVGPEAYAFKEIGDGLVFVPGAGGIIDEIKVILSSWGCSKGHWNSNDCLTPRGATFKQAVTLNIYGVTTVAGVPTPGALLTTVTKTFDIRYRPSADPVKCSATPGKWYSEKDDTCYNGIAVAVEFDLSNRRITVPDKIIVGVAYNSSHFGYAPIGEGTACYTTPAGCPYDSLNVSTDGAGARIGAVIDPNGIFINYTNQSDYCPPHAWEGDRLQFDNTPGCWAGYHPQIEVVSTGRQKHRSRKGKDPSD